MNIFDELKKDHDEVKAQLDLLVEAESVDERRALVAKVRDMLVPHARAEEAVFYNILRDLNEGENVLAHAYQEHVRAETLLRAVQVTEAVAINWKNGVNKLKEEVFHHIQEEQEKVFPVARRALTDEDAKSLGEAFVTLKGKLGANLVASQLELIANLMPMRFRKMFLERMLSKDTEKEVTKKAS